VCVKWQLIFNNVFEEALDQQPTILDIIVAGDYKVCSPSFEFLIFNVVLVIFLMLFLFFLCCFFTVFCKFVIGIHSGLVLLG
jgi:hypothetical protein